MINFGNIGINFGGKGGGVIADGHRVLWLDYDGTIIKDELVPHGKPATPPEAEDMPQNEHLVFNGWDRPFDNITEDTEINALYDTENGSIWFHLIPRGDVASFTAKIMRAASGSYALTDEGERIDYSSTFAINKNYKRPYWVELVNGGTNIPYIQGDPTLCLWDKAYYPASVGTFSSFLYGAAETYPKTILYAPRVHTTAKVYCNIPAGILDHVDRLVLPPSDYYSMGHSSTQFSAYNLKRLRFVKPEWADVISSIIVYGAPSVEDIEIEGQVLTLTLQRVGCNHLNLGNQTQIQSANIQNCSSLRQITLPNVIKTYSASMLRYCGLDKGPLVVPEGVETVGRYFAANSAVREVSIPSTLTTIDTYFLENDADLEVVKIAHGWVPSVNLSWRASTKLKKDGLVEFIQNLGETDTARTITLASAVLNSLTEEEKAIAVAKGYSLTS